MEYLKYSPLKTKRSLIIEFLPRSRTYSSSFTIYSFFDEIRVVAEYKYLDLIIDRKLTLALQVRHITKNLFINPLFYGTCLKRLNLWTILINSLFEMLIFPNHTAKIQQLLKECTQKFDGPLKNPVFSKKYQQ